MTGTRVRRVIALAAILAALVGCFVLYGALEPDPNRHAYPGGDDIAVDADAFLGERVSVGGTVVDTDPVVIAVGHDRGTDEYTVENAPSVEVGQELRVFATLESEHTLLAHESLVRDGWELAYMYAISIVAALWLLARALSQWRVNVRALRVEPRTERESTRGGEYDA